MRTGGGHDGASDPSARPGEHARRAPGGSIDSRASPAAASIGTGSVCSLCHRSLGDLRRSLSADAMRGGVPLCPVAGCPIVARLSGFASLASLSGRVLEGPAPSLFVGRFGYPNVRAGPLVPPGRENDPLLLAPPRAWLESDIATLLSARTRLLRTRAMVNVTRRADPTRLLEAAQAAALSVRPVDTEVVLTKELRAPAPRIDALAPPMGPGVDVERARVLGNPNVPRRVDALTSDTDAPAGVAVAELADAGIPGEHIERLLAAGLLGERNRRRLVPTRWSITATDDMLGKRLLEEIRSLPELSEIRLYEATRFGNHFILILFPSAWAFEMVEAWKNDQAWEAGMDSEGYRGRTGYVEEVAGAYYAARLAVAEELVRTNRQAAAFVAREITEDYWAPLGVWVIRETCRLALRSAPLVFGEARAAIRHLERRTEYGLWEGRGTLLRRLAGQTRLRDFGVQDGAPASPMDVPEFE